MLGEVTRFGADGSHYTMIMLQQFIHSQGDAWQCVMDTLTRAIQYTAVPEPGAASELSSEISDPQDELLELARMLGRRLGEMHAVLATPTDDPEFSPEAASEEDAMAWAACARRQNKETHTNQNTKKEWSN